MIPDSKSGLKEDLKQLRLEKQESIRLEFARHLIKPQRRRASESPALRLKPQSLFVGESA